MKTTTKDDLADILTQSIEVKEKIPSSSSPTCLLVDGPALIQTIGKPEHAKTFQDLPLLGEIIFFVKIDCKYVSNIK